MCVLQSSIPGGLQLTVDSNVGILIKAGIGFQAGFGFSAAFEDKEAYGSVFAWRLCHKTYLDCYIFPESPYRVSSFFQLSWQLVPYTYSSQYLFDYSL